METSSIWENATLEKRIAVFVSYSAVFKDVISLTSLKDKLGFFDENEFNDALRNLEEKQRVVIDKGFVAIPQLLSKILAKPSEFEKSKRLIQSKTKYLNRLAKLPIIKFIGISGSVAANNPVENKKIALDLDVFVITRNQCIWFFYVIKAILDLFEKRHDGLNVCINYIIDESDLTVQNKNFYTAHEIWNIVPISGVETYQKFIYVNNWINFYFPGYIKDENKIIQAPSRNMMNKFMFLFINIVKSLKNRSLNPLTELTFRMDPTRVFNFNRRITFYGGYQAMVQKKFKDVFNNNFPEFQDDPLLDKLFDDELSHLLKKNNYQVKEIFEKAGFAFPYSKYEQ